MRGVLSQLSQKHHVHTGKPEGVALPLAGFKSLVLTVAETRAGVRIQPEFAYVRKEKENEAPSLTRY